MFELPRLQGSNEEGIALQTKTGRNIPNSQGVELDESHLEQYESHLRKHGQRWQQRKPPTAKYNCAGHVWASRRTCIYDAADWKMILKEDGYRSTTTPTSDDLVLYIEIGLNSVLHIGRVLELRKQLAYSEQTIPWIVSKWSDTYGETCHFLQDHPYPENEGFRMKYEFWTDRPVSGNR